MDNPHIMVFFLPEYGIITDVHLGCRLNLGEIGLQFIPGLFRNVS